MDKPFQDYRKPVIFQYKAAPGSKVFVSGAFNNWNPTQYILTDELGDGVFKTVIELGIGTYQYKFIVNGIWRTDPNCSETAPNEYGTQNSVITV
jgi:1,4-alpha-glucan branching enzyme